MPKRILFIHRSVGQHLIDQGKLRQLLKVHDLSFDDYNNNSGVLTHNDGTITKTAFKIPGGDTKPQNLAAFFEDWDGRLNDYNVIMIKSCYPNSHIKTDAEFEQIKAYYQTIIKVFAKHLDMQLIVLTSPPLRPIFTNQTEANNSSELGSWLISQATGNIHVFDYHTQLSEPSGRHSGMLKRRYRRIGPWDNHPNSLANKETAPKVVDSILQAAV